MGFRRRCYRRYGYCEPLIDPMVLGLIMFVGVPFGLLVLAEAVDSAPVPITRVGTFCPIGYYRTGPYCSPLPTQKHQAVERLDSTCPLGSYTEGNYCKVH